MYSVCDQNTYRMYVMGMIKANHAKEYVSYVSDEDDEDRLMSNRQVLSELQWFQE